MGHGRLTVKACSVVLLFWCVSVSAQGLISRYIAGEHYKIVDQAAVTRDDDKIHVAEFFLYSCPHCYHLEPELEQWRAQLGDDVAFERVPVLFGRAGRQYAQLYYTARALDTLDAVHADIFKAIHQQGRRLTSPDDMRAFMVAHGVEGERFDQVLESNEVKNNVRRAGELARLFQVKATPSLEIADRYWVSGRTAGSNDKMLDVADYLIDQERAAKAE